MAKALLVCVDGTIKSIEVNSLKDLQSHVGGYIESLPIRDKAHSLYVNEEGKLRRLPINKRALEIAKKQFGVNLAPEDFVVGNMIIVGLNDKGEDVDISESVQASLC